MASTYPKMMGMEEEVVVGLLTRDNLDVAIEFFSAQPHRVISITPCTMFGLTGNSQVVHKPNH